jgi:hypothetical protein
MLRISDTICRLWKTYPEIASSLQLQPASRRCRALLLRRRRIDWTLRRSERQRSTGQWRVLTEGRSRATAGNPFRFQERQNS